MGWTEIVLRVWATGSDAADVDVRAALGLPLTASVTFVPGP